MRAVVADGQILDAELLRSTRSVISPTIKEGQTDDTLLMSFDYLDPLDGYVVQLIHSGLRRSLRVVGSVKEIPGGLIRYDIPFGGKQADGERNGAFLILGLGLLGLLLVFLRLIHILPVTHRSGENDHAGILSIFLILTCGALVGSGMNMLWKVRRRYPASLAERKDTDSGEESGPDLTSAS